MTVVKDHGKTERTFANAARLWIRACLVVGLGVGFFWFSDELHFDGKWRLYVLQTLHSVPLQFGDSGHGLTMGRPDYS
jgi:hypothetical protein